ncbi:MAG: hypothetical protein PW786_13450 [Arachidicoccus sp.]|nr:hypothetical protein [Arachidicoccus sp.]
MSTEEFYNHELIYWGESIEFYLQETAIFEERLKEVINKNTKLEILAVTEHFQNVFIIQKESLDILGNDTTLQKERLVKDIKDNSTFDDLETVDIQFLLRERVHMAEKIFLENKHSFYRFLASVF